MCSVSMVGDHYRDIWRGKPWDNPGVPIQQISRFEFEELKRQVTEMKLLLERAVKYDEANNQPHCETEDKMEFLRKVAELVGVKLNISL